jgi:hypothetical protein
MLKTCLVADNQSDPLALAGCTFLAEAWGPAPLPMLPLLGQPRVGAAAVVAEEYALAAQMANTRRFGADTLTIAAVATVVHAGGLQAAAMPLIAEQQ